MTTNGLRARNLRTLAVLAALFLLPLMIAFVSYYGTAWRPAGHVNHGLLIAPARALPAVALPRASLDTAPAAALAPAAAPDAGGGLAPSIPFRTRWSLVYVGDGTCDAACREALYVMRQTRISLNNDMTRVERVFLVTGGCCAREFLAREHPGLVVLDAAGATGESLARAFPAPEREHTLYIVDPLGNLVMSYDVRQNPHGLLEDLKKLLRLSHIG